MNSTKSCNERIIQMTKFSLKLYTYWIDKKKGVRYYKWIRWKLVTKISMDPCMEVHSPLWEGEGGTRPQFFPSKAPSAAQEMISCLGLIQWIKQYRHVSAEWRVQLNTDTRELYTLSHCLLRVEALREYKYPAIELNCKFGKKVEPRNILKISNKKKKWRGYGFSWWIVISWHLVLLSGEKKLSIGIYFHAIVCFK